MLFQMLVHGVDHLGECLAVLNILWYTSLHVISKQYFQVWRTIQLKLQMRRYFTTRDICCAGGVALNCYSQGPEWMIGLSTPQSMTFGYKGQKILLHFAHKHLC